MKKKGPNEKKYYILVIPCNCILFQFCPLGIEDRSIY